MLEKINDIYAENIQTQIEASRQLPEQIVQVAQALVACLLRGNKIIICAHGRSYANAQCLTANLLNRYALERPSFPSVLLQLEGAVGSAIIADNHLPSLYQRQFDAVAQSGDLLFILSPFGNEEAVLNLINSAVAKEINMIALTSSINEHVRSLLSDSDLEIAVPSKQESRILENHLFVINAICELIDHALFA